MAVREINNIIDPNIINVAAQNRDLASTQAEEAPPPPPEPERPPEAAPPSDARIPSNIIDTYA